MVIFDEAHELADVAANLLGLRVASGAIANLLNHLYNERSKSGLLAYHGLPEVQAQVRRTLAATDAFFDAAADWQSRSGSSNGRVREKTSLPETLVEELRKLATAIGQAIEPALPAEQRIELESAQARCRGFAEDLVGWLKHDEPESVYWIEVEARRTRRVVLARVPLDLGPILRRDVFDHVPVCIMTSATLSVGSPPSFHFSKSRLGLSDDLPTSFQGSPFDHERQLTIHLAQGLPDPASETKAFEEATFRAIPYYVRKTQGKALVLFTSHRLMDEATRQLSSWFRREGITLFSQSSGGSRSKLLKAFEKDVRSVLFGTDSFWQGIDVPGESLSNVIITKLPFDAPSQPLLEARYEAIERRGGHSFLDYSVPEAVLKFKQGIGRLIRSKTDRGIVVILDPRVLSKPYGKTFRLSLPPGRQVVDDWRSGPPP